MITLGNFFFKYRNYIFPFFYIALFISSIPVFSAKIVGQGHYLIPLIAGLIITITGQAIRGATIGLVYIQRGGKDKKVHAEELVTEGIFHHCRNPLYVGNILMLLGVGILANTLLFIVVFIPLFLFIYQAIVLAEENFLRRKFGESFDYYCKHVNRWIPNLKGIRNTFKNRHFSFNRWVLKEYNTQFVWLLGIMLILLFYYPQLTHYDVHLRNRLLLVVTLCLFILYLFVKYLKKSGKMTA